jgi:hypothetical protein
MIHDQFRAYRSLQDDRRRLSEKFQVSGRCTPSGRCSGSSLRRKTGKAVRAFTWRSALWLTVDHLGQPEDYIHTDGTVWTWQGRWHFVRGVRLRSYDLVELTDVRHGGFA